MDTIKWHTSEVSNFDKVFENIARTPPAITILFGIDGAFKNQLEKYLLARFRGHDLAFASATCLNKNLDPLASRIAAGRPILLTLDGALSAYSEDRRRIVAKLREFSPDRRIVGIYAIPEATGNSLDADSLAKYPPDPEEFDLLVAAREDIPANNYLDDDED